MALLALLWLVLSGGGASSWVFGAPLVLGAVLASLALRPAGGRERRLSLAGAARFAVFFARESVAGGVDVALRALRPDRPLDPGFVWYEPRLPEELPVIFMANTTSLLPGTLSAELRDGRLRVHTLTSDSGLAGKLATLEERVAGLFGIELSRDEGAASATGEVESRE